LLVRVLDKQKNEVAARALSVQLPPGGLQQEVILHVKIILLWDEFNPALYTVKVQLSAAASKQLDAGSVVFGMREMGNQQCSLWVNDHRIFLRGTLECNIFPLTGHPPMEKSGWIKVFSTAKAYGLNHLRFHSWCPPEAAF